MCQMASFFHKTGTEEVVVYNLNSHSVTERKLKLDLNEWDEGHYLPNGTIEARVKPSSRHSQEECSANIKARFPSFIQFLNWAFTQALSENLYLSGLTSAEGLKLPSTVGGYLDLSGLTSAEGLKLPSTVGGPLDLSGLTSAEHLKLPSTVGGSLYLGGLTSAKHLKLPSTVGGALILRGLTSAEIETLSLSGEMKFKVRR